MDIGDFCRQDRTRLQHLAGDRIAVRALRDQIAAAYAGVASIDSDELEEFDDEEWDEEELAFIFGSSSNFNRLEPRQRAEYLRMQLQRPLRRREGRGAELLFSNILPAGRRRKHQLREGKAEQRGNLTPGGREQASDSFQEKGHSSFLVDSPVEEQSEGTEGGIESEGEWSERVGSRLEEDRVITEGAKRPRRTSASRTKPQGGKGMERLSPELGERREGGSEGEVSPRRTSSSRSKPRKGKGMEGSSPVF
jgi:hypothetical protein